MKDLEKMVAEKVYIEKYDINVIPYLTDVQIMIIAQEMLKQENKVNRDIYLSTAIFEFCTDITEDEYNKINHDILVSSGILDAVFSEVKNINKVVEYVEREESFNVAMTRFVEKLTDIFDRGVAGIKEMGIDERNDLQDAIIGKVKNLGGLDDENKNILDLIGDKK